VQVKLFFKATFREEASRAGFDCNLALSLLPKRLGNVAGSLTVWSQRLSPEPSHRHLHLRSPVRRNRSSPEKRGRAKRGL